MKKIIFYMLMASVLVTTIGMAQSGEGIITYEMKINMHRNLPKDREDLKAMIPEFNTTNFTLAFNGAESLYKVLEDEGEDVENFTGGGAGGPRMMMRRMMQGESYLNTGEPVTTMKQEFMGKEYLIEDSVKLVPWKFGTETRTVAGYPCKMAYYTDESRPDRKQEITAWYTDKLRPFLGPERFNTLPGAVLAVDINGGDRVFVAKKIDLRTLKKNELKKPSSGTKITGKEFRTMMENQMKEMRRQGGGNFIIRN
ncbi:MAG: GLPGLI family protein [Bacteroidota bacterium]